MSSVVSAQYTSVTDRQTPHDSIYYALRMRRAVKIVCGVCLYVVRASTTTQC